MATARGANVTRVEGDAGTLDRSAIQTRAPRWACYATAKARPLETSHQLSLTTSSLSLAYEMLGSCVDVRADAR